MTGQRRAGHAGTLDPLAQGVLPVVLGRSTRLIEYLSEARKTYRAGVRLGVTTTTLDAAGEIVTARSVPPLDPGTLEIALSAFRGPIEQVPPMYSALKVAGRRLYDLARQGQTVERAPRRVVIHRLTRIDYQAPDLELEVECSKGTYIRSLADDLGRALGCGAHLAWLIRTRVGPFDLAHAVDLDRVAQAAAAGDWDELLWAGDEILIAWPAVVVADATARAIGQGRAIPVDLPATAPARARAYSLSGEFLAVLEADRERSVWRPAKVLQS